MWPDPTGQRKTCPVFNLPAFKGSWALCAEGLAHPHTGETRPITFDPVVIGGRDDIVLAYSEHRLVQICLLRLPAGQGLVTGHPQKSFTGSCPLVPDNALTTPAVIAHGRLVVLGGDNQRLHEEVIMARRRSTGRSFRPEMNVGETKAALDAALNDPAHAGVCKRLQEL